MKRIKFNIAFFLFLLTTGLYAQSVSVNIYGHVLFGIDQEAAPDYPVWITTPDGTVATVNTNADGFYAITLELEFMAGDIYTVFVEVLDFCTGEIVVEELELQQAQSEYIADFHICSFIDPPPPPDGCGAYFDYQQMGYDPIEVAFFDISYSSQPVDSWNWDFGDGTSGSSSNPVHNYTSAGTYLVTLTISSDTCTSIYSVEIEALSEPPCVCPQVYDPVCVGDETTGIVFSFPNLCWAQCAGYTADDVTDCTGSAGCTCPSDVFDPACVISPDGQVLSFSNPCWALCDGYQEGDFVDCEDYGICECPDVIAPVCVLSANGDTLTFLNVCYAECEGFTDGDFIDDCNFSAGCPCPEYYDPVCVVVNGDTLTFDNPCFSACEGYGPDDYFECGPNDDCNCPLIYDPVCVLTAAGVIIVFPNSCIAECEGFVEGDFMDDCEGSGNGCFAAFDIDIQDQASLTVSFIDQSYTEEGEIVSWHWEFGDGQSGGGPNPVHTYQEEGIYEVTLTIETSSGCSGTVTQHICIGGGIVFEGPDCQAMFFFEQDPDNPLSFQFTSMSFGEIDSWFWEFGDGSTSEEENPVHVYNSAGIYFVTLTVTGEDCQSTVPMILFTDENVFYENQCNALFLPFIISDSLQVFFLNLSSPDAVEYHWDLGDGTTSNEFIVFHQYAESGVYEINLTVITADGCTNTFGITLNLEDGNFTGNPSYLSINSTEDELSAEKAKVYPSPASEKITIMFEVANPGDYQLSIVSPEGKEVGRLKGSHLAGSNHLEVLIHHLPPGIYLIRLETGTYQKVFKMVKARQ